MKPSQGKGKMVALPTIYGALGIQILVDREPSFSKMSMAVTTKLVSATKDQSPISQDICKEGMLLIKNFVKLKLARY